MGKNLPVNAGDLGPIPEPLRLHQPKLLSPCAADTEPVCLEPVLHNKRSPHREKPMQYTWRVTLTLHN